MEYIQHLERQNFSLRISGHSRNRESKFNIIEGGTFKFKQCKSTWQNLNLSLHSAKRRQDMIESDSNQEQAERFYTMYNYEFSRIIFKLVLARCLPVAGLESGFVFHYAQPFITLGHSYVYGVGITQTDLRGMLNSRYIYNKKITTQKVLCTDFYSLVAKLWKTHSFAALTRSFSKVLQHRE